MGSGVRPAFQPLVRTFENLKQTEVAVKPLKLLALYCIALSIGASFMLLLQTEPTAAGPEGQLPDGLLSALGAVDGAAFLSLVVLVLITRSRKMLIGATWVSLVSVALTALAWTVFFPPMAGLAELWASQMLPGDWTMFQARWAIWTLSRLMLSTLAFAGLTVPLLQGAALEGEK